MISLISAESVFRVDVERITVTALLSSQKGLQARQPQRIPHLDIHPITKFRGWQRLLQEPGENTGGTGENRAPKCFGAINFVIITKRITLQSKSLGLWYSLPKSTGGHASALQHYNRGESSGGGIILCNN